MMLKLLVPYTIALAMAVGTHAFLSPLPRMMTTAKSPQQAALFSTVEKEDFVEAVPMFSSVTDPEAVRLRDELIALADKTQKGVRSTRSQKERAREIIADLSRFNPTPEPASAYYASNANKTTSSFSPVSLAGKWELIYTDAPDITSLDFGSRNPFATAKLGRIGQECTPPFIKNVIEWKRPEWADQVPLPFVAGNKNSSILQKVCTKASASATKPMMVNLEVVGIDLVASPPTYSGGNSISGGTTTMQQNIEQEGLLSGWLRNNPVELRGPLTAPFGQFEILYLDEELRIIRTNQNFLAVNKRSQDEWF